MRNAVNTERNATRRCTLIFTRQITPNLLYLRATCRSFGAKVVSNRVRYITPVQDAARCRRSLLPKRSVGNLINACET